MTGGNRRLWGMLIVLNLAFIWGNSLLSGETSGQISGGMMAWLQDRFQGTVPFGELLLRKMGHFAEFACLGFLLQCFFCPGSIRERSLPLLCGVFSALTDETIQCFVPGRGPAVTDVWIDTAGIAAGMILCEIGYYFKKIITDKSFGGNKL